MAEKYATHTDNAMTGFAEGIAQGVVLVVAVIIFFAFFFVSKIMQKKGVEQFRHTNLYATAMFVSVIVAYYSILYLVGISN